MKHTFLLDKFEAVTRGLRELMLARFAQCCYVTQGICFGHSDYSDWVKKKKEKGKQKIL